MEVVFCELFEWLFQQLSNQGDYYRYIAEYKQENEKSAASEKAHDAYKQAMELAKSELLVTHPIRIPQFWKFEKGAEGKPRRNQDQKGFCDIFGPTFLQLQIKL